MGVLGFKGSWDLVTELLLGKLDLELLETAIRVLITLLTKSHDPPS